MGQLNLFKLDKTKINEFWKELDSKYKKLGEDKEITETKRGTVKHAFISLFVDRPDTETYVEWNWLTKIFEDSDTTTRSNPKGILVIKLSGYYFACTYGYSYLFVDKFCDTDFAFNFARRIEYSDIKTTTLLSPNLKRRKVTNAYIDYSELEFDSGESFAKLKVKVRLPEGFSLYSPALEIGHSIKFHIENDSLRAILDVIYHVNFTIKSKKEIYKIPLFNKVKDEEKIIELDNQLKMQLKKDQIKINLSELDIIGVTETFIQNYSSFSLKYYSKAINLEYLDEETILEFFDFCHLAPFDGLKKVKVYSMNNGIEVDQNVVYNLVDYTDDANRCVLSKGKWYYYNDDYLQYLADSISEIDVIYEPEYDFTSDTYEKFIQEKYQAEKNEPKYKQAEESAVIRSLKKKYYKEYAFNLRVEDYGYQCFDRRETRVNNSQVELMDLYRDESVYAVKFGSCSSKLCYAIDQSLSTLNLYKHRTVDELPNASKFGVWFHLNRKTKLALIDGKPDINELNMLILKNKLDDWKKAVRVLGYKPVIRINYCND